MDSLIGTVIIERVIDLVMLLLIMLYLLISWMEKFGTFFRENIFEPLNQKVTDALGDMLYILCGTILEHGMQYKIEEVFEEIQRSNMSKLGSDGKPIYREDGKVLKGPDYFKPDIEAILER